MGLTEEQLKMRTRGIGASEIAAIAGMNPWKRPIDVYLDKKGLSTFNGNWRTQVGDRMEPLIAQWYAAKIGAKQLVKGQTVVHPEEDWILATPDFHVHFEASPERLTEIKNVGFNVAHHWDDGVPQYVECQVHWQSAVTRIKFLDVAASIDGEEPQIWQVEWSTDIQTALIEIGRDFWFENVLKDIPPEPDGSEQYATYLKSTFRRHSGVVVRAPEYADHWVRQRAQAMADLRDAEERKLEAENRLKSMIGENAGIWSPKWRATWVKTSSGGVDWKGLAEELSQKHGVERDLLERYTRPGNRQFQIRERRNVK